MSSSDTTIFNVSDLDNAESIDLVTGAKSLSVSSSDFTVNQSKGQLNIGKVGTAEGGALHFRLTEVGTEADPTLTIGQVDEGTQVDYTYDGSASDAYTAGADGVTAENLTGGIQVEGKAAESVLLEQGVNGDEMLVNADGSVQMLRTNDLITSTQDLAVATALMWRSQLSSLSDRMGTLRTMPETAGAWARYNNGRLDGDDTTHDYNTVELGFDKAINDNVTLGVSFDYTKGDTDVFAGNADSNTYTFGLYGSYFNDSGCYLDTMLKVGRVDADYDLRTSAGAESADYMMSGVVLGIETGHRWDIQNFFVEPQIQLTYSYLRPDDFTTSLNHNIKFEDMDSLIARVGVMAGMKFAEERGAAYVKASYNHDFLGDVEGFYREAGLSFLLAWTRVQQNFYSDSGVLNSMSSQLFKEETAILFCPQNAFLDNPFDLKDSNICFLNALE